jgi:acetoin utilization deacetylase AcuC-like enzyme
MTTVYSTHSSFTKHDLPGHPEHSGRIEAIWKALKSTGLDTKMTKLEPQRATDEQILAVHTREYLDLLMSVSNELYGVRFDSDTYALPESPEVARLAAGGVISLVDAVARGDAQNGLALVRPPGHHAIPTRAMGFCLLGNIAIATRHAQTAHKIERVMIVDFDVHHGNGTQDMFYNDDSVLFISTHQYPYYPGTGNFNETGTGSGKGYTINIPLPAHNGDQNYALVYEQIIWRAARRFQPQLILVSAGFDAHFTDPLAMMRLSLTGYAHLTRELIRMAEELSNGKIVFVMEGGYDLDTLAHGMCNITYALLGNDTIIDPLGVRHDHEPDITPLVERLQQIHNL